MCDCREGIIEKYDEDGQKVGEEATGLGVHDCEYVKRRNALIPEAESLAIKEVGRDDKGRPNSGFSRAFMREMDRLAKEIGI